ncbi:hypothetical protein PMAYCL1PPCAC_16744, partial [Pristionchus mayeri]
FSIHLFSICTTIIALRRIATYPLIPYIIRSLLFLTILRNPINIVRRIHHLSYRAFVSVSTAPPLQDFTNGITYF